MGRKDSNKLETISFKMDRKMLSGIDKVKASQGFSYRSEAIRLLLKEALKARGIRI